MAQALSQEVFNQQVLDLLKQHGAGVFAAVEGQFPMMTLFVEGDQVVAISADNPRHCYGAFCELPRPIDAAKVEDFVHKWIESGEAYSLYLSMNVCRYNC